MHVDFQYFIENITGKKSEKQLNEWKWKRMAKVSTLILIMEMKRIEMLAFMRLLCIIHSHRNQYVGVVFLCNSNSLLSLNAPFSEPTTPLYSLCTVKLKFWMELNCIRIELKSIRLGMMYYIDETDHNICENLSEITSICFSCNHCGWPLYLYKCYNPCMEDVVVGTGLDRLPSYMADVNVMLLGCNGYCKWEEMLRLGYSIFVIDFSK